MMPWPWWVEDKEKRGKGTSEGHELMKAKPIRITALTPILDSSFFPHSQVLYNTMRGFLEPDVKVSAGNVIIGE
jgi:hypothetical protein